jgi:two-component system, NtrC family, sensor histidine kinase KinB
MATHADSNSTSNVEGQASAGTAPDGSTAIVALYRAMAERSPLPIAMSAGQAHVLCAANPAFCHLLGAKPATLLGRSLVDAVSTSGADRLQALLDEVYRTGTAAPAVDMELTHAERGQRYWTYTVWPIPDDQGRPAGLVLLVNDTTAHHRDEQVAVDTRAVNEQLLMASLREQELAEQLQRQLAFINAITNSLGEGVYALDRAGRFTFVNPAAEQLLGWTEAELLGRDVHAVIHLQSADGVRIVPEGVPLQAVTHSGTTYRDDDVVLTRRDGAMFPAAYSAAPIVTDGQVMGAVVAFRDMTEVRRLQQAQEEYLNLISHDLRAPLTSILAGTELLLRTLTQQGLEREALNAKIVVESSHRMNHMIEGLLDRSRLEAGQDAMRQNPIDLVQLATRIIDQTVTPADRKRIHLEGAAELPVVVDAAQIERVIINLLTNALKFSGSESPVVVGLYQDGNRALVSIADQGGGIDPQDLPHVFEKHYRARTRADVEGSGLGLYISRLIVEAHGGRLWAESRIGMGSCFTFALPMTQ